MKITAPAAKVQQGELVLFTTSLKVRDLMRPGFYSIERLDSTGPKQKGYQRLLQKNRARKLADYIIKGQETADSFLPTSVFLATEKTISYNDNTHEIAFSINPHNPMFSVVDGQHRLEGLRMASDKDESVMNFEIPVNIAHEMPFIHQMCHFLIVNTTQKSVDKGVEQNIYSRLTQRMTTENVPSLPKWIQTIVDRGVVDKALEITKYLNETEESPWQGKIEMANEIKTKEHTIKQGSFVNAIQKYVLTPSNPIATYSLEQMNKILLNYWKAIAEILDNDSNSVLFKTNGLGLFCRFSSFIFMKLDADSQKYTVDNIQNLLQKCFDNMEGDYDDIGLPNFGKVVVGPQQ